MSSRPTRESGGGVLSFTFLDVLTCTMGSLVLLVVILGQKAAHTRLEDALRNGPRKPGEAPGAPLVEANPAPGPAVDPAKVAAKLAELKQQEAQLAELRAEAAKRIDEERDRVSHLEEHERRLEHELAKLHITLQRLAEAEKKQSIDQDSADRDLERLKQLVKDTEAQLEALRSEPGANKSYAIVPYKGANGTYRRPVYIECTKDAVTIQPEGIVLTAIDFDGPIRSGNPLAAAVRAAREELNARAAAAGQTDMPDPYPLLIVRPDGSRAYGVALSAISAWDADFGYEFVDSDWKLEYPDPDPKLSQTMAHAVDQARARQAMLAKVAPRRYGGRLIGAGRGEGGGVGGSPAGEGSGGFDTIVESSGAGDRIGERAGDGLLSTEGNGANSFTRQPGSAAGNPFSNSTNGGSAGGGAGGAAGGAAAGNFADQFKTPTGGGGAQSPTGDSAFGQGTTGQMAGGATGPSTGAPGDTASAMGSEGNGQPSGTASAGPVGGVPGGHAASGAMSPSSTAGKSSAASASAAAAGTEGATASPSTGGEPTNATGNAGGVIATNANGNAQDSAPSAAETRGVNWANAAASRRSSAITRPIQVVVRPEQIDVLPTREDGGQASAEPTVVSFHQPTDKVLDQLAAVLQQHIKDWGLAGQNMYWRPTLVLQVAPGADQHAVRLNDLLKDSGVDVRLSQIASRPAEEPADARR
ncbi:MAG: hypothetical protein H0T51_17040 [Pirellulales bacterium]|nr:hypothetical protein [Pirellulales bacterium]